MLTIADFERWRAEQRERSDFACQTIRLDQLKGWFLNAGRLAHETGGFFSIVGVRCESSHPALDGVTQPIIHQPEIGILGFLRREGQWGPELLLQAKTEPGNVGSVQFAPSFQCTESNYRGLHGAPPAPLLEWFNDFEKNTLSNSLQIEQGTRFLRKANRNMVVDIGSTEVDAPDPAWRWVGFGAIRNLLAHDNALNTDARSVLSCTDWFALADDRKPFQRWRGQGGLGEALLDSYLADDSHAEHTLADIRRWYRDLVDALVLVHQSVPIETLDDWILSEDGMLPKAGAPFVVRYFRVQALDREVPTWDQPLVQGVSEGRVVTLMQRQSGVLHFLVRPNFEIGNYQGVQLSLGIQFYPGEHADASGRPANLLKLVEGVPHLAHLSVRQSEEGGRFYQEINRYDLIEVLEDAELPDDELGGKWVTLSQLQALTRLPLVMTNEARSATSLLLYWL